MSFIKGWIKFSPHHGILPTIKKYNQLFTDMVLSRKKQGKNVYRILPFTQKVTIREIPVYLWKDTQETDET